MRSFTRIIILVLISFLLIFGTNTLRHIDPFRYLNRDFYEAGMGNVGLRMNDTTFRVVSKGKLTAELNAERIDITKDRSKWLISNVTSGDLLLKDKKTAKFTAHDASYDSNFGTLLANATHISFTQGALDIPTMLWDKTTNVITSNKALTGTLSNGPFLAESAILDLSKSTLTAQKGSWRPKLKDLSLKPMKLQWDMLSAKDKTKIVSMKGVDVFDDVLHAHSDTADYKIKGETLLASGNIKLDTKNYTFSGNTLYLQRKPLLAKLKTNIKGQAKGDLNTPFGDLHKADVITVKGPEGAQEYHIENFEVYDRKNNRTLSGKVADFIEGKKAMSASGDLILSDDEVEVHAQKMVGDTGKKVATLTGGLHLTIKPKKSADTRVKNDTKKINRQKPVNVTANELVYYYGKTKVAIMKGSVHAKQELDDKHWRTLDSDDLHYDRDAEKLTLTGNVVLKNDQGAELHPEHVIAITKEGEESIEMRGFSPGKKNVIPNEDNSDTDTSTGEAVPPAAPPPPKSP